MIMASLILDIDPPVGSMVRFVSDIHWGHPRSTAPGPRDFMRYADGADILVLCGDTAETHPNSPYRERGTALREEFCALCAQAGIRLILLAGNHDPDIELQMLRLWGGRVVAMHGHALVRGVAPWSREYICCESALRRMIDEVPPAAPVEEQLALSAEIARVLGYKRQREVPDAFRVNSLLREAFFCFWPPVRPWRIVRAWLTCTAHARAWCRCHTPDAQTLIFGHFHRAFLRRMENRTLVNTGAWFSHASPYAVDMRDAALIRYGSLPSTRA